MINIIIYILKRFFYKNYEISNIYAQESYGFKKYSIREKYPLYGVEEDVFLQKHKNHTDRNSSIKIIIKFEEQDKNNLEETFNELETLYNINDLDNKILTTIIK